MSAGAFTCMGTCACSSEASSPHFLHILYTRENERLQLYARGAVPYIQKLPHLPHICRCVCQLARVDIHMCAHSSTPLRWAMTAVASSPCSPPFCFSKCASCLSQRILASRYYHISNCWTEVERVQQYFTQVQSLQLQEVPLLNGAASLASVRAEWDDRKVLFKWIIEK